MDKNWYLIKNIDQIDTPALIFYPERIKQNIEVLKSFIDRVNRLRPHVKTHKCIEVTQLLMQAGITKFKCATIAEAEMLAMCKAPDVLLAYQPVLAKANRLVKLTKKYRYTQFSCLVDNVVSATMLSTEAEANGLKITVYLDLNTGMNRTGILPSDAFLLYKNCHQLAGLNMLGLHAYDGHINTTHLEQRTVECLDAFKGVQQLAAQIVSAGYGIPVIIAGGTPTYPILARIPDVECSPGTFALWDDGYQKTFPDLPFLPSGLVATRVISVIDDHTVCLDLGHKSIASENTLNNRVVFLNAPNVEFVSHSEEHLVIRTCQPDRFKLGEVLYGLPVHICPTCALHDRAFTIVNGEIADRWLIVARNRTISV